MPVSVKCPACHTTIPGKFEVGEPVKCDLCGEAFEAPPRPVARAVAPPAGPQPPAEKGPAVDFDFSRKPNRTRRPTDPERAERADNGDRPKARRSREEPDERPRSRHRDEPSGGVPVGLIVGGVLAALFLMLLVAGGGGWYLLRQARQEQAEQQARALDEEWRAEEERRRAAREREAWLEQLNRQQQAPNPAAPPNNFVPPLGPRPPGFNGGPWAGPNQPPQPAEPTGPAVPPFDEPKNPSRPGTQTTLRELRSVTLPRLPAPPKTDQPWSQPANEYTKLVYAPKRDLLFALSPRSVWVYDVKAGKEVGSRAATESFTDLSLSPDQSALFVADYGGEHIGYGDPIKPSRVHRFDLAARKWEERKAPKIAWMIEAADAGRVLLLERDQWVDVTLNKWEEDGVGIRELARIRSEYNGDIEYDPRTGRIYHGSRGTSSPQITVRAVVGDKLKAVGDTGPYGSASQDGGGGTVVLSQDGSRLYYGALQVGTGNVGKNLQKMQGLIYAASRDVAFSDVAYYRASTGSKLGEFGFKTTVGDPRFGELTVPPAITVSPDGLSVWVVDRDKNTARQFALDGAK